jgi:hypothetical protein
LTNKEEISDFTRLIESIVITKRVTYIDAVVLHCNNTGLEIEVAAKLIGKGLRKKLKEEAITLSLLPKPKGAKLKI